MELRKRPYWLEGLELSSGEALAIWNARQRAQQAGDLDWDRRLRAILLVRRERWTQESAAHMLEVTENAVTRWVMLYVEGGIDALRSRKAPGRTPRMTDKQLEKLAFLLRLGPEDCGYDTGVWDSKLVTKLIEDRFGVRYHPGNTRKILKKLGFSVQVPKKMLARADPEKRERWLQKELPNIKKKRKTTEG